MEKWRVREEEARREIEKWHQIDMIEYMKKYEAEHPRSPGSLPGFPAFKCMADRCVEESHYIDGKHLPQYCTKEEVTQYKQPWWQAAASQEFMRRCKPWANVLGEVLSTHRLYSVPLYSKSCINSPAPPGWYEAKAEEERLRPEKEAADRARQDELFPEKKAKRIASAANQAEVHRKHLAAVANEQARNAQKQEDYADWQKTHEGGELDFASWRRRERTKIKRAEKKRRKIEMNSIVGS